MCVEADYPPRLAHGDLWRARYIEGPLPPFDVRVDMYPTGPPRSFDAFSASQADPWPLYLFVPITDVKDGQATYKRWTDSARRDEAFDCAGAVVPV